MTLQVTYKVATFPKFVGNVEEHDVGGGGGDRAPHLNLTVTCIPRVGILII